MSQSANFTGRTPKADSQNAFAAGQHFFDNLNNRRG
jgi:hypothetical protein